MGYRMMSKFFLKMLCLLVLTRKTSLACQLLEKSKRRTVSAGAVRSGRLKTELRLVMQDKEGRLGQVLRSGLCVPASGAVRAGSPAWRSGARAAGER